MLICVFNAEDKDLKIELKISSDLIYKKYLTFLIHCINDVFGLYSR